MKLIQEYAHDGKVIELREGDLHFLKAIAKQRAMRLHDVADVHAVFIDDDYIEIRRDSDNVLVSTLLIVESVK